MNEVEIYTLQDEEGNELEFELVATCEKNGTTYYAMVAVEDAQGEGDVCEYTILKAVTMVVSMVEVGEETGALPEMLIRVANTYDDEVDNAVAAMTSIIEPIMIIFLAVVVGGIVIAMFMPLISIIGTIGQQGS